MREELKALEPYRVRSNRINAQRMDLNENPYGCSKKVMKELGQVKGYELYPEYDGLLEALAEEFSLKKENFILTCGGDDAIRIIIDGCVDKGNNVVLPSPTYSMLPIFLKAKGAMISEIPYKKDLSFPSDEVFDSIDKNTALVALVNPGNPTGGIIEEKDLERVIEKGPYVLLDETYWQFAGKSYASWVKRYSNLFIVQSFSKAYGLAGLRIGFVASDEKNIEELRKIALPYSVSS
ncbi:MAG: aminotransferase class I/II-fold pyridoxal phosphate-dependent enzyme, partial [Candidatus Thermoplasmatota archaeon]|nr:aminotransferase class I/II-fold pyridoxal phosphate-dependent enzyme [Candidatus Thermoplasmatota archaeon]